MPRASEKHIRSELDHIVDLLRKTDVGARREVLAAEYAAAHGVSLPPRMLQRRLERLIIEERVQATGEGRSTTYRSSIPASRDTVEVRGLSAQGARLKSLVQRSIESREPVGYDRDWLFQYQPGTTWYLSKANRALLREIGSTASDDRPAGTFARDILGRLLIDLSWASSHLEGNTYTRLDTKNLLEFGQRAEGKDAAEAQMILNHKNAIEFIVGESNDAITRKSTILSVHALLSENLLKDPSEEGRLRERPVLISGSRYTPTAIPQVIHEAFDHIVDVLNAIPDPFEQAFFSLVHVSYLQPFVDVNKRTSRLLANLPLMRANLAPLSFVGANEAEYVLGTLAVYEHGRTELLRDFFLTAYAHSAKQYRVVRNSRVEPDPIRLKYRTTIGDVIRAVVLEGHAPNTKVLRTMAESAGVPSEDRARFVDVVLEQLLNLSEGTAARYRLRPGEFAQWRRQVRERASVAYTVRSPLN